MSLIWKMYMQMMQTQQIMRLLVEAGHTREETFREYNKEEEESGETPKKTLKLQERDRTRETDFGVIHSTHYF